jgi:hypothetical protein
MGSRHLTADVDLVDGVLVLKVEGDPVDRPEGAQGTVEITPTLLRQLVAMGNAGLKLDVEIGEALDQLDSMAGAMEADTVKRGRMRRAVVNRAAGLRLARDLVATRRDRAVRP